MKDKIKNYRIIQKYILLLFLCLFNSVVYGKEDLKSMSDFLDQIIDNKEQYTHNKNQVITSLKKILNTKHSSLRYEYEINSELYKEYRKFKLDSAIYYARRNVEIANLLNDKNIKHLSEIKLASVYSFSGKFLESEELLKNIQSKDLPKQILGDYYEACSRFYEHYAAASNQPQYNHLIEIYRDSLLAVIDTASFRYKINMAHKSISRGQIDQSEKILFGLLETQSPDTPEYAQVTHSLGMISGIKGDPEQEKKYYILSAIADIKNSIKENASFRSLALIYYNNGDITRAFKYAQSAIEDAVFSGVQFRTAQLSEFYSIINASYQAKEAKTNSKLKTYLTLISVLLLFLILLVLYIYKQMKRLSGIKEKLFETNKKLSGLNKELNIANDMLQEKNNQLYDANHIKEQYIAQFFYLCSSYIDKMEENRKSLYKLVLNRQYEELHKMLKSTNVFENELDELYSHFDSIFISLYPTFVDDFNALLAKDDRIVLKSGDILNKELRIYALLRLGITDGAKIASFLRCSMSTIYNYRTKIRNRAACDRDRFEERVMRIGVLQHNDE
ncbi:DUF6377 domain-containing protein [Coprobacter tertius]|uniref:DUF6377 domain-containing protein n=1 Tax=Coprobacter tertius TaxID=2944915 RepID=A0ABT1MGC1_9BACT|nr:DUF6377 domain-containing protein [Coprobacter tertius]MCP9611687.1 DUF6377 domain-containing protein [Coprobacter tertius]